MRSEGAESNLVFCRRAKKFARDGRDQMTRNQALKVRAKIVAASGDDVTFSRCQGSQSNTSDFFGGFTRAFRSRRRVVARHDVKLRFRSARAEAANPDTKWLQFLGEAFRGVQIENLGGGISRDVRHGLERRGGCDDQDVS